MCLSAVAPCYSLEVAVVRLPSLFSLSTTHAGIKLEANQLKEFKRVFIWLPKLSRVILLSIDLRESSLP